MGWRGPGGCRSWRGSLGRTSAGPAAADPTTAAGTASASAAVLTHLVHLFDLGVGEAGLLEDGGPLLVAGAAELGPLVGVEALELLEEGTAAGAALALGLGGGL